MSFIMIVICQVGLKQTMAFVVDEKHENAELLLHNIAQYLLYRF